MMHAKILNSSRNLITEWTMVKNRSSSSSIAIIDFVDIDRKDGEEANLWFLLLALFPITCVFGNLLVVLAVAREKNLKTWTNYLLVSLATADMLVALLVMPFSIYLTVRYIITEVRYTNLIWRKSLERPTFWDETDSQNSDYSLTIREAK
uniref:G-protein coupled receptors family 1 profile domain-containing protein n=1 Tax=Romanomermis culicivorax TaxID=13658 RepID=A0A915JZX9_ROMCU